MTSITIMLCFTSHPSFLLLLLLFFPLFLSLFSSSASPNSPSHSHGHLSSSILGGVEVVSVRKYDNNVALPWETTRSLAEHATENGSLVLAPARTRRKDPLDHLDIYTGGWNITNQHYIASVMFTAVPFFIVAAVWFVVFGLCLSIRCLCYCCCPREPYGYSRVAYALSLIFLIIFTLAAIAGCIILYIGQGKFYTITSDTVDYVVSQTDLTVANLTNVSSYLDTAKGIEVDAVVLPPDVQKNINDVKTKIDTSTATLSSKSEQNLNDIQDGIDEVRSALIVIAAIMLFITFLGFLFSVFGMQCLVNFLVIVGWILVTGTFFLCGVFLFLHNAAADTCVAMDEWVQNPTAHTALDDILPCVDNTTAQETLLRSKEVTYQLVRMVDSIITNVTNRNSGPSDGPLYYNQSGPPVPFLCSPFNSDLSDRRCEAGEVALDNATEVWKNYTCQVSSSGICTTTGRMTPSIYSQVAAAVNVSYGLYRYSPFLIDLVDCTLVRDTFTDISNNYCPGLQKYTRWIYVGLVIVSVAVMLSLIFWVIYSRERQHRVYTKNFMGREY